MNKELPSLKKTNKSFLVGLVYIFEPFEDKDITGRGNYKNSQINGHMLITNIINGHSHT
jgi:hypothetical protein